MSCWGLRFGRQPAFVDVAANVAAAGAVDREFGVEYVCILMFMFVFCQLETALSNNKIHFGACLFDFWVI